MNLSVHTPTTPGTLFPLQQPVLLSSSSIPHTNNNLFNSQTIILAVAVVVAALIVVVVVNIFNRRRKQKKNPCPSSSSSASSPNPQSTTTLRERIGNFDEFLTQNSEQDIINLYNPHENPFNCSPLHFACYYGHPTFVKSLLDKDLKKLSLDQRDKWGFTPLMSTCYNMFVKLHICRRLRKKQCNNLYQIISILLQNMKPHQINMVSVFRMKGGDQH